MSPELECTVHVEAFIGRLAAGAAGSALIAALAYRQHALTRCGAWAAVGCGTILYGAGGAAWAALVGAFFLTSSALTRLESGPTGQGGRSRDRSGRDWTQVVANGGVATATAVGHAAVGSSVWLTACAGAIAVATADTWATEIGRFSRAAPRLITTWGRTVHGASGGITGVGTAAACGGALLIASIGAAFALPPAARFAGAVAVAGFSGSIVDSLLGATIEQRWRWINNNAVNLVATAWGALVAAWLAR